MPLDARVFELEFEAILLQIKEFGIGFGLFLYLCHIRISGFGQPEIEDSGKRYVA